MRAGTRSADQATLATQHDHAPNALRVRGTVDRWWLLHSQQGCCWSEQLTRIPASPRSEHGSAIAARWKEHAREDPSVAERGHVPAAPAGRQTNCTDRAAAAPSRPGESPRGPEARRSAIQAQLPCLPRHCYCEAQCCIASTRVSARWAEEALMEDAVIVSALRTPVAASAAVQGCSCCDPSPARMVCNLGCSSRPRSLARMLMRSCSVASLRPGLA